MAAGQFANPFRPGAGHMPPYLAGRAEEAAGFQKLLQQKLILENLVLTGLRGVGKTVLAETFKPLAIQQGWGWVGTDLSESSSTSEGRLALRLMADLALVTSSIVLDREESSSMGFLPEVQCVDRTLDFETMAGLYKHTPGLVSDKIKAVLEFVWRSMQSKHRCGLVFAYDEAQNLSDHPSKSEYPLSLMLDVFQSIQRKGMRNS